MLAPDDRTLLLDAMRPPEGYLFDYGVGTSFTLNLLTLLIAPVSLALHDVASTEEALSDPILLLDGIRRYSKRLTVFCQTGFIAIPRRASHLYRFVEDMVVEVQAPNGGLFHPKVWLLRYKSDGVPDIIRFLCLSRNMDFSRSWDVLLRLEGEVQDRVNGYGRNAPLAEFFHALPTLSTRRISPEQERNLNSLTEDARRVDFHVPSPFFKESLEFIPLGHRPHRRYRLDDEQWRGLTVSPFLSEPILRDLTASGNDHVLLSEAESLKMINPDLLKRFDQVLVFNDVALSPPEDGKTEEPEESPDANALHSDPSRLHAKLFVQEKGWDARWLMGSANATSPAWSSKNVEFMVGLTGRKSRVGIDEFLGEGDDDFSLRALLATYDTDADEHVDEQDSVVNRALESVREAIVESLFKASLSGEQDGNYDLRLLPSKTPRVEVAESLSIMAWPITLQESRAIELMKENKVTGAEFRGVSLLALTTFVAFHIDLSVENRTGSIRFVLQVPVSGMPENRDDVIVGAILSDKRQFLRYLRFLLAQELGWIPALEDELSHEAPGSWDVRQADIEDIALLEDIARAFSRAPEKIDQVSELILRLRSTEQGRAVLPDGFEPLWDSLQEARDQS